MKEPLTFSGNSFENPAFVTALDSIIVVNIPADKYTLFYLEKCANGKANEALKGFLATNSDIAYIEARKLLDQHFGNPVIVAENFKSKLRNWRQIHDGDSRALQEFSDFPVRCDAATKSTKSMAQLDSPNFDDHFSQAPVLYWCPTTFSPRTSRSPRSFCDVCETRGTIQFSLQTHFHLYSGVYSSYHIIVQIKTCCCCK